MVEGEGNFGTSLKQVLATVFFSFRSNLKTVWLSRWPRRGWEIELSEIVGEENDVLFICYLLLATCYLLLITLPRGSAAR